MASDSQNIKETLDKAGAALACQNKQEIDAVIRNFTGIDLSTCQVVWNHIRERIEKGKTENKSQGLNSSIK